MAFDTSFGKVQKCCKEKLVCINYSASFISLLYAKNRGNTVEFSRCSNYRNKYSIFIDSRFICMYNDKSIPKNVAHITMMSIQCVTHF